MNEIYLVVVLYNPSEFVLKKWMSFSLENKQLHLLFIDNSSSQSGIEADNCAYYCLYGNKGIASAQNYGIKKAIKEKAKYIIFFDQDSEVDSDYCQSLLNEYIRIKSVVPNLGLLGPTVVNKESGIDYKSNSKNTSSGYSIVSALISSGTLVEIDTLRSVGMMEDALFIDAVDFEWCWRASSKGYVCARTSQVKILHKVGQNSHTILGMPFIVSAPLRYYYQYRNWIWLLHRQYVPSRWKRNASIRRVIELLIIPLITDKKKETLRYMLKGIKDGLHKVG